MSCLARGLIPVVFAVAMILVGGFSGDFSQVQADDPPSKPSETKPSDAQKVEESARLKDAAFKVAETYLILLDKGKFAESWDASAADLRNGISRVKWVDALNKTRRPFGRLRKRKLNRVVLRASENPERLDQLWVYSDLVFQSDWTKSELVVVVLERGKDWKASSYFIGDPESLPKPPETEKVTPTTEDAKPDPGKAAKKPATSRKKS